MKPQAAQVTEGEHRRPGDLRAYLFDRTGAVSIQLHALPVRPAPEGGFTWFDVTDPGAEHLEMLQGRFGLHPLAVEDALHAHQRAKVEGYSTFQFVVVHGVSRGDQGTLNIHELNLFVGADFVISVRHGHGFDPQHILDRWERVPQDWQPDPSSLFYVLLDALVDDYAPFTDALEDDLRDIRHQLVTQPALEEGELRRIFTISELAYAAHAVAFPLKDVLTTLLRAGPPVVSELEIPYFRDIRDHVEHVVERLNLARATADRAFDIYQSLEAREQGAASRQLTQVATVFLPLTLVTGFFGQNFSFLVDRLITSPRAFWIFGVGLEVLVLVLTLIFVRRLGRR
ncbi:magnesium and cobalt transport protein CorA [Deinococcus aerius]|uniref:Magnesium and cobalt transport protein CorA n=2 Tax=Deinococcus TaxID=1298 RepID=A0A2I9DVU1_9DEIO|nr:MULTISPECIES: magnesium transporter CorA family protein [Deinococcus]MBB5293916.1 magnesium transporter [Deinococcus metallilatus]QBY07145.1 hypothetical protein E5F05_03950 [Deinococcus metallilatus]RXJ14617.1 hypothetical protein ERJ73_02680 [Deinococcus metallilatus]TLK30737.1 magnesium transporter CorA family protein [Deinococcus metallilatus]GBF04625.1 magnesium and cobalt transport protein CorA [Deinococcus aerius]